MKRFMVETVRKSKYAEILQMIRSVVVPATGCTEPVAIALNAATAKMHLQGEVRSAKATLDIGLMKNAMGVAIPGIASRGPASCLAVGILIGTNEKMMDILSDADSCKNEDVEALLPKIQVSFCNSEQLLIETILFSDTDSVRVITHQSHANIVSVEHGGKDGVFSTWEPKAEDAFQMMSQYELADLLEFANTVDVSELAFLKEGLAMNMSIAERGTTLSFGELENTMKAKGFMTESLVDQVEYYASCASYARMSGETMPVMTVTGSGNQGIALFVPIYCVANYLQASEETLLRAVMMAQAFNLYAKHYLGVLSPLCSCGIASGVAASVGIVYLMGGQVPQMESCIRNMLCCITGMVCDGAKESCATKVGMSSGLAVKAALMAMEGFSAGNAGIITSDIGKLYEGVGKLSKEGMGKANAVMIQLMQRGE